MLKLVSAPVVEPVQLAEVKAHAVISHSLDDALLSILISAAREHGESLTGRSWAPKTLEVVLDAFPSGAIELPASPIQSITSVKYLDSSGVEKTLVSGTDYYSDIDGIVGRVVPKVSWPIAGDMPNAVRVRYQAGWIIDSFPPALKQWMLIRVASLYAQRESFVAGINVGELGRDFVDGLLDSYTVVNSL